MEPMILGSPSSSPPPSTLPNFLFGDAPAPPPSSQSPVASRQQDFPSPIPRNDQSSFFTRRLNSPILSREPHRAGAPPVLGLGDVASPYAATRRQLDYTSQNSDDRHGSNYDSMRDSFHIGRPVDNRLNGDYHRPITNGFNRGDLEYEPDTASPHLRRAEVEHRPSAVSRMSTIDRTPAGSASASAKKPDDTGFWVTVFGFPPGGAKDLLPCFLAWGQVIDHQCGDERSNWVHLKYPSSAAAVNALARNGTMQQGYIIGVKRRDDLVAGDPSTSRMANGVPKTVRIDDSVTSYSGVRDAVRPFGGDPELQESSNSRSSSIFADRPVPQREKGFVRWAVDWVLGV